jgi:hypothetical protein
LRIVAIDPGLRVLGVAVFVDGSLTDVSLVRGLKSGRGPGAWRALAKAVEPILRTADLLVIERPQIYQGRKQIGDPDDLMELMGVVGAIVGLSSTIDVVTYRPKEWKSNVPKDVHQARLYAALSPEDQRLVDAIKPESLKHNALDAVGIGCYYLRGSLCKSSNASTVARP